MVKSSPSLPIEDRLIIQQIIPKKSSPQIKVFKLISAILEVVSAFHSMKDDIIKGDI
jgi:hypothetical protein